MEAMERLGAIGKKITGWGCNKMPSLVVILLSSHWSLSRSRERKDEARQAVKEAIKKRS